MGETGQVFPPPSGRGVRNENGFSEMVSLWSVHFCLHMQEIEGRIMLHLDLDTAIRLVDEAIAEKGEDFIYRDEDGYTGEEGANCKYVHHSDGTPTPGCLVGHVLIKLGIDPMSFERIEGEDAHGAIAHLEMAELLTADRSASEYLMHLQSKQDTGNTWGEARDYARKMLEINGDES